MPYIPSPGNSGSIVCTYIYIHTRCLYITNSIQLIQSLVALLQGSSMILSNPLVRSFDHGSNGSFHSGAFTWTPSIGALNPKTAMKATPNLQTQPYSPYDTIKSKPALYQPNTELQPLQGALESLLKDLQLIKMATWSLWNEAANISPAFTTRKHQSRSTAKGRRCSSAVCFKLSITNRSM